MFVPRAGDIKLDMLKKFHWPGLLASTCQSGSDGQTKLAKRCGPNSGCCTLAFV